MKSQPATARPLGIKGALGAILLALLWGANVVAIKTALGTFPPFWAAFWRMAVGLAPILMWSRKNGTSLRPQAGEWLPLTALGLLMTVQMSLVYLGVNLTSAAYAAVLLNSHPIFTNLLSHFYVPGDQVSGPRVAGLAIAFGGISVTFLGRPDTDWASRPLAGNLLTTLAGALAGALTVVTKRVIGRIDYIRTIFCVTAFTVPFYLVTAVTLEPMTLRPVSWEAVLAILYQGIIANGVCVILWVGLLRSHRPGVLSMFGFLSPIFGVAFSAIAFSERLSPALLGGLAAVAAGLLIVTRQQAPEAPARPPSPVRGAPR